MKPSHEAFMGSEDKGGVVFHSVLGRRGAEQVCLSQQPGDTSVSSKFSTKPEDGVVLGEQN